jgi:hypothetical protein
MICRPGAWIIWAANPSACCSGSTDDGRAVSSVAARAQLAERGLPCARPPTPVAGAGSLAVHAEEFRPGGEVLHGDSPDVAVRNAEVFARLMAELAGVTVAPPLLNPPWVRWDHTGSGVWPAIDFLDNRDQSAVPAHVVEAAERVVRQRWAAHAGADRQLRGVPGRLSGRSGAIVHGRGAGDRVGGQRVDGRV